MSEYGLHPLSLDNFQTLRSRQVPLHEIDPERGSYQFVSHISSRSIDAALIDLYDPRVTPPINDRAGFSAMLFRDELSQGLHYFKGYEANDINDYPTIYPDNDKALDLYIPRYDRIQLLSGFVIAHIYKNAERITVAPQELTGEVHSSELDAIFLYSQRVNGQAGKCSLGA